MKRIASLLVALGLLTVAYGQSPSLEPRLDGKTVAEKARIKSEEIVKAARPDTYERHGVRVEIESIQTIEGGIEVYARAWKNEKQLGFGKDGTVDIERFRIFNPPVLVPDPNGSIVRSSRHPFRETVQTRYREDPAEALRLDLAHTISVVGKNGIIVPGKRGNTTSTFYPDAHTESTSADGAVFASNSTWAGVHGASSGTSDDDATSDWLGVFKSAGSYFIWRFFHLYDTSALGSDTITSATVSLWITTVSEANNDDGFNYVNIYASTPASNTAIANEDFDQVGATAFSDPVDLDDITTGQYTDWPLNATGRAAIDGGGITKLSGREGHDAENETPSATTNADSEVFHYHADRTGTTNDPKLVVEHEAAVAVAEKKDNIYGIMF